MTPGDLTSGCLERVRSGARAAGTCADALVLLDEDEDERRQAAGLGAVTALVLLDRVMNLPLRTPVRNRDIDPVVLARLDQAPPGVVVVEPGWVTRVLQQPLTVVAASVQGVGWRRAARAAAAFEPFAQRIAVLSRIQAASSPALWEAQISGTGVWTEGDDGLREVMAPRPFVRQFSKAAGWRFAERAYGALLADRGASAIANQSPTSGDRMDHPAHTGHGVPGRPPAASPLW